MAGVKLCLRVAIFVLCLAMFVWQAYEIIDEYQQKDIATKVSVLTTTADASHFDLAYCYDPINTLQLIQMQGDNGETILANPNHLDAIPAMETYFGQGFFVQEYAKFFKNVSENFEPMLKFTFTDDRHAQAGSTSFRTMFHPLLGLCSVISASDVLYEDEVVLAVTADAFGKIPADGNAGKRKRRQADEAPSSSESPALPAPLRITTPEPPLQSESNEESSAQKQSDLDDSSLPADPRLSDTSVSSLCDESPIFSGEVCCANEQSTSLTFTCCTRVDDDGSQCCCRKDVTESPCGCNFLPANNSTEEDVSVNDGRNEYDYGDEGGDYDYQPKDEPPQYSDAPAIRPLLDARPEIFANSIGIFAFDSRQFFQTASGIYAQRGTGQEVEITQDVVDKTEVSKYLDFPCSDDPALDEDSCLSGCLVDRFVREAGCVHPRLEVLMALGTVRREDSELRSGAETCDYFDLSNLLSRNVRSGKADESGNEIEPGLSLLKNIMYSFSQGAEERCGCPKPCVRRHFKTVRGKEYGSLGFNDAQVVMNVDHRYYSYVDSATFDFVKMLADLGGYLGLMLGYSAYSIADFVDFLWKLPNRKTHKMEEPT